MKSSYLRVPQSCKHILYHCNPASGKDNLSRNLMFMNCVLLGKKIKLEAVAWSTFSKYMIYSIMYLYCQNFVLNIDTRNPTTIMPLVASFGSWVCSHIPCTTILRACTTPFQVVCLLWPIKADLWYLFWGRGQNYRKSKVLLIKSFSNFFL